MNVAFVENAQHNIDRRQSGRDQQGLTGERVLKRLGDPLKAAVHGGGQADLTRGLLNGADSVAQGRAGRQIERDGDSRKLALVIDGKRRGGGSIVRERAEWYQRSEEHTSELQ